MTTIDPGEGYLLLEEGTMQEASDEFFSRRSQSWRPVYNVGLPVKRGEHVRRRETTVTTSGPYVAIEVHRAALAEIERLKAELEAMTPKWKRGIPTDEEIKNCWIASGGCHDSGPKELRRVFTPEMAFKTFTSAEWHCVFQIPKQPQPSPEPEWFDLTPFVEHVLRMDVDWYEEDNDDVWSQIYYYDKHTIDGMKQIWGHDQKFRCLLKDAPPELVAKANKPAENAYGFCPICGAPGVFRERRLNGNDRCSNGHEYWSKNAKLNRPAEDPDEWVTQDRVPARRGIDERRWKNRYDAPDDWGSCEGLAEDAYHGMTTGSGHRLELRCRRRDLPPMPDKPKTEREVSLYWYDGNVVGRYADCPPTDQNFIPLIVRDGKVFIETETREVNRG